MQIITQTTESAHFYSRDGQPMHTVIGKSTGRPRPTTIKDARENGWLPSVSTVLKVLDKPALTRWKVGQGVLACMTAPRVDGEGLDAFIDRVLNDEQQQDQEAQKARDLGTDIHAAIEACLNGRDCLPELAGYVGPVLERIKEMNLPTFATEKILVGDGYAGMTDCLLGIGMPEILIDFKTTKSIPAKPYKEHQLQIAAYVGTLPAFCRGFVIYISTTEPGKISVCEVEGIEEIYTQQWLPLLAYYRAANNL